MAKGFRYENKYLEEMMWKVYGGFIIGMVIWTILIMTIACFYQGSHYTHESCMRRCMEEYNDQVECLNSVCS